MLKYIFVLLALIVIEEVSLSQQTLCSDIKFKDKSVLFTDSVLNIYGQKNPFLSGLYSFLVPGLALGQIYNEQFVNAGIRNGITLLSVIWLTASGHLVDVGGSKPGAWQAYAALSLFAANWLSSVVDAVFSAISINEHIRLKNKYLQKDTGLHLNFGYGLKGIGIKAALNF